MDERRTPTPSETEHPETDHSATDQPATDHSESDHPGTDHRDGGRDEAVDALKTLPASDWVRLWCNIPAKHLPEAVAREVQLSITGFGLDVSTYLTYLASVATTVITLGLVPLSTERGQLWLGFQIGQYTVAFSCVWYLRRLRRHGTLTTARFNTVMLVPTIVGATLWGVLPLVVGDEPVQLFFLACLISALASSVGYFWTLGHWPLSMLFAFVILTSLMTIYRETNQIGSGTILMLGPILFLSLLGISVMAQGVLVRSRYFEATARDREQTIGLILQDYERGGQDFLWDTDANLCFTHVPPQMQAAGRGDPRIARGASLAQLVADHPSVVAAIQQSQPFKVRVLTNGPSAHGEVRLWGQPKLVQGKALGYRGVGSDVDAVRRAAEAERTSERLDAMVALTSGLAHDFNNQLATVLGAVELAALDNDVSASTVGYLNRAVDACLRTRRITADLVVASGYDATYQPADFDLGSAVGEVVDDLQTLFPDVELELHLETTAWVTADRDHYIRAVHNLVQNACQAVAAMPPDRRRVDVRVHPLESTGGTQFAVTDVSDLGPGVPDELAERIFEPFSTTRRSVGGTGLGLSVARGFAHQARGCLTLEHSAEGALFRLSVPVAENASSSATKVSEPSAPSGELAPRLNGRFLVIEDDQRVADNVAHLLQSFGGTTEVASSVAEAIERFAGRTGDVECVISDLVLPDGEGYDVIAALRREHPALRAIYMSGFTRTLPTDVAPELRCPFLAKPFSAAELARALERTGVPADPGFSLTRSS